MRTDVRIARKLYDRNSERRNHQDCVEIPRVQRIMEIMKIFRQHHEERKRTNAPPAQAGGRGGDPNGGHAKRTAHNNM